MKSNLCKTAKNSIKAVNASIYSNKPEAISEALLDPHKRDQLIMSYLPVIKAIALKIKNEYNVSAELGDMINCGVIGLIDALEKYQPSRKTRFYSYAKYRIKGSIIDGLRQYIGLPRILRKKRKELETTFFHLEQKLGRGLKDQEAAQQMGIELEDFYQLLNKLKMNGNNINENDYYFLRALDLENSLECNSIYDPLYLYLETEIKEIIKKIVISLPPKERFVISFYYYEDLTMNQISQAMGITESRVSQIHTQALLRMKARLSGIL